MNEKVVLEKGVNILYRKLGEKWVKVEEEALEVSNGEEVAVSVGLNACPRLYFKILYE